MAKSAYKGLKSESTFVEGDLNMKEVRYVKLDILRVILFTIGTICTGGFLLLIWYWLPILRRWMLFKYVNTLQEASHFLVICWDDVREYPKKEVRPIYNYETHESKMMTCFVNRHLLYTIDEAKETCTAIEMPIFRPFSDIVESYGAGLDEKYAEDVKRTFGECKIDFHVPSYPMLFVQEVLSFFFVFQIYSAIVWFYQEYTVYAIVILCITAFSSVVNLYVVRSSLKKIHRMAFHTSNVSYYTRRGDQQQFTENVSSTNLLPGSILVLKDGMKVPCDCILIEGQVLMDECSLTGESVAVTKSAVPRNKDVYNANVHKIFTVYEGTTVKQINKHQGEARALVIRTGFGTMRGQLVRGILYPKPHPFKFASEVYYFMLILGLITIGGFAVSIPFLVDAGLAGSEIAIKILDLITISIPPALPAALTVGVGYALARLKQKKIDCISPPKTQVAGRVDAVCFDKTGTITNDDMDLKGIRLATNAQFGSFLENLSQAATIGNDEKTTFETINAASAACHDINMLGTEVIGDPMEIKLVEFTGLQFSLTESRQKLFVMKNDRGEQIEGLKRFEFNPNLQRMSVIGAAVANPNQKRIYTKGAPEVLTKLCVPNTVPADFEECLSRYTQFGYRVLAVCYRDLSQQEASAKLDDLNRTDCERDLIFLGFAVFQNKPKPQSKPVIEQLHEANVLMKMSTGDNPVTGAAVAKEVSIIPENSNVFICDLVEEEGSKLYIDIQGLASGSARTRVSVPQFDQALTIKELTQEQTISIADGVRNVAKELPRSKEDEIAFTGRAFSYLYHAAKLMEGRRSAQIVKEELLRSKVYARMQPNHKILLIEMIQKTNRLVAMVGDGANDCGALRTADIGLALSQAEASISAPFNSKVLDISSFLEVLKEGRCALATNFHNFKFMALYSMCQFSAVVISYTQITNLGDYQFLWQDLAVNFPLFLTLGYTKAYPKLTSKLPDDTLFSAKCLISVLGSIIIETVGCVAVLFTLKAQEWYEASSDISMELGESITDGQENGLVWLCSSTFMIFAGLAFAQGKPFRKPVWTNIPFMFMLFATKAVLWFLMIEPETRYKIFEIPDTVEGGFFGVVFGITVAFGIAMLIYEWFIVTPLANLVSNCCRRKKKVAPVENDMDAPLQEDFTGKLVAQRHA